MTRLDSIFDSILDASAFLAGILLVFQMLSVCWEVVMRYFFNSPTIWVMEICGYTLLWIPFLSAAWALREGYHVKMDIITVHLSPKSLSVLNMITAVIAAVICFIITFFGIKVAIDLHQTNFLTQTGLMLPKWPIVAIIPVSTLLLFIEFLRKIYKLWIK